MEITNSKSYDPSPKLNNSHYAKYIWGHGTMVFASGSYQEEGDLKWTLTAGLEPIIDISDPEKVAPAIALIHELRHLQQDFTTGVGLWDYVFRVDESFRVLNCMKWDNLRLRHSKPDYLDFREQELVSFMHGSERNEIKMLREVFSERGLPDQLAGLFTVGRLLELDAMLYTNNIVTTYKWRPSVVDVIKECTELYSVAEMPSAYTETYFLVVKDLHGFFDDQLEGIERLTYLELLIKKLISIAFYHPDPTTISKLGIDPKFFHPGVKFLTLLQSLHKIDTEIDPSDFEFEEKLLSVIDLDYPDEISWGKGWIEYLEDWKFYEPFSEFTKNWIRVLSNRYQNPETKTEDLVHTSLMGESLLFGFSNDVELLCENEDGSPSPVMMTGKHFADNRAGNLDKLRHIAMWELANFMSGNREDFICPFSKKNMCPVEVDSCSKGYSKLLDFPEDESCRLAQTLDHQGQSILV